MSSSSIKLLLLLFVALLGSLTVQAAQIVHLDKQQWRLQNANKSLELRTQLPAYPLEVLRANGVIQDPNYRYGELESRWVALDTWTFTLEFDSNQTAGMGDLLAKQHVLLQLGGVDTFGTVTLNDEVILKPNNFHRTWAVSVKDLLVPGLNTLSITIRPAAPESTTLKAQHPYSVPSLQQLGSIGAYVFARKPASDFGWDWGPAYAASGVHGFVNLLGYDVATVTSAFVAQSLLETPEGNKFAINITSQFVVPTGGDTGSLQVEIPGLGIKAKQLLVLDEANKTGGVTLRKGSGGLLMATYNTNLTVNADDVELWWPAGYGQQFLYDVTVSFTPDSMERACARLADKGPTRKLLQTFIAAAMEASDYTADNSADGGGTFVAAQGSLPAACGVATKDFSSFRRRIGFRTVELVRLPIDLAVKDLFPEGETGWNVDASFYQSKDNSDGHWAQTKDGIWKHFSKDSNQTEVTGESFYFKVNGVPVYMKGANYIPSHIIHTNATTQMINDTLQYALESNMNMIRVWGGGRYPMKNLFNFADEHGILIWMETMFACAPYPRDPAFLDNVAAEVAQQVQRLSWHPSVAIWGGNNEIEGSLNWYAESRSNRAMFANDYEALFINTIRKEIRTINPSFPFVDSSPSNGVIADNDREYVKRWGDDWDWRYGDTHWYAYESDCEDWTTYPKSKFISEFGSQSYPTFATYAEATAPEDWQVDNPMTGFRNRRFGNGLQVFEAQFKRHFRLPDSWAAPQDPERAYKLFRSFFYITHMQQARCYEAAINYWRRLRSQPAGLTMGVLYWQLNDIAHFASWSSYDYGGRWKPLAYSIKRMYAPLQVQVFQDGNKVKVFLVNDHVTPVRTTMYVSLLSLDHNSTVCGPSNRPARSPATASVLKQDFEVPANFAAEAWSTAILTLLRNRPGCTVASCYVSVIAVAKPNQVGAGEVSEAQLWLVPLKDIDFPNPELSLSNFRLGADQPPIDDSLPELQTATKPNPMRSLLSQGAGVAADVAQSTDRRYRSRIRSGGGVSESTSAPDAVQFKRKSVMHAGPIAAPPQHQGEQPEVPAQQPDAGDNQPASEQPPINNQQPSTPVVQPPTSNDDPLLDEEPQGPVQLQPAPAPINPPKQSQPPPPPGTPITFTLSAQRPAALTNLLTNYRGRFSDDAFTAVHPCSPRTITFYPHASEGGITAEDFAADLQVESLFDHQYGKPEAKAKTGGAASVASFKVQLGRTSPASLKAAAGRMRPN